MSRNFELLQNLGKEHDMFQADLEPILEPAPVSAPQSAPLPELAPVPLRLNMEEGQRDELTRVVQRLFLPGTEATRAVVMAGSETGSGCSWVCARMAEILASQVSASVCVVDANFAAPGLHQQFETENHTGLSDALREQGNIRKFARQVGRENLWLLSCGADSAQWQSLISSDRMRARVAELRSEFHYVLIDGPALNTVNDSVVLGRAAEGVVVVIKANSSRRETARKAVRELESAKVRVLGAILNQRTFPIPQGIYNKL
ncbi:MAG: CpsD/CapB family tyrosine-protein kinase [Candidatus Sulfotelmatobacter sp.]